MKKVLSIIALVSYLLLPKVNFAQNNEKVLLTSLYFDLGVGVVSKGPIFGISANTLFSNNWGGSFAFNHNQWTSENLPPNYYGGMLSSTPFDYMNSFALRLVKNFPLLNNSVRFGIEGGLSFLQYEKKYFVQNLNSGWFGSNFNEVYTDQHTLGISFKAKSEFCLNKFIGFQIAAISNINQFQPYIGGEIHLILGKLK